MRTQVEAALQILLARFQGLTVTEAQVEDLLANLVESVVTSHCPCGGGWSRNQRAADTAWCGPKLSPGPTALWTFTFREGTVADAAKALLRRFLAESHNKGNFDAVVEFSRRSPRWETAGSPVRETPSAPR
jgi:hypothetical protein